jgi:hypothetical protein
LAVSLTVLAATLGAVVIISWLPAPRWAKRWLQAGWSVDEPVSQGFQRRCLQLHAVSAAGARCSRSGWSTSRLQLAGVPLGTYALTTLIGIIPGTFAFSVLGSGLDSIIEAQKAMHDACIAEKGASELHLLA